MYKVNVFLLYIYMVIDSIFSAYYSYS